MTGNESTEASVKCPHKDKCTSYPSKCSYCGNNTGNRDYFEPKPIPWDPYPQPIPWYPDPPWTPYEPYYPPIIWQWEYEYICSG